MSRIEKPPDKIIYVDGHEFRLYRVYDEAGGVARLEYPDFPVRPVYTARGRPFALTTQEGCSHGKHYENNNELPYDCNECDYFQVEKPTDAIGVCMCEELRRTIEEEK